MSVFKIYVTLNYFYVEDNVTNEIFSANKTDVRIHKPITTSTKYRIKGVEGISPSRDIEFADIRDGANVAYASQAIFETFYETDTGG